MEKNRASSYLATTLETFSQQKTQNRLLSLGSFDQAYLAPILNILVPHVGQTALTAGLPFFIVTLSNSDTSFLALHFTQ